SVPLPTPGAHPSVVEDLRLGHLRGQLPIVPDELGLQDDHRPALVQRSSRRGHGAVANTAHEICLGLDGRRALGLLRHVEKGAQPAAVVGQPHQRSTVHDASHRAAFRRPRQPCAYDLRRGLQQLDPEQALKRDKVLQLRHAHACIVTLARLNEPAPTFDLQSHSRYSDGALAPAEVVGVAATAGVELLALSDHDTIEGVPEAAAEASRLGIRLVGATEISALDPAGADLHILGYGIDAGDAELAERLAAYRADREQRADRMAEALRELGFELDDSVLQRRAAQGKPIGRPHLSAAVVTHPANARRLADEGRLELSAFLEAYLIEGRPGFRSRTMPTVEEAISTIHRAGGVAVWAHPFWDIPSPQEVLQTLERFRGVGIDGVECFYTTHTREQSELLADR